MKHGTNLTSAEERLAEIIWNEAPLSSPELVSLAERLLDWKKSTTYTVLRKLCDKDVFKNENARVSVLLTRNELITRESHRFVEDAFGGSLPRFIATFISGKKISRDQAEEIRRLIEENENEENVNENGNGGGNNG